MSAGAGARRWRDGYADLIAVGRLFVTNPGLPARLADGAPPAGPPTANVHGGGPEGCTDCPAATAPRATAVA